MSGSNSPGLSNRQRKSEIRASLRKQRRELSSHDRAAADRRICANLQRVSAFRRARTVAAFLAFDGEPSLSRVFADSRNANKRFLVPVLRARQMSFAPLGNERNLRSNAFGIAEPRHHRRMATKSIDVVLVPLVGFDAAGNRLGMGGGFYDRHFHNLLGREHYVRPKLIGIAYELQRVAHVPRDAWDVPLWGIVTNSTFRRFHKEKTS